MIRAIAFDLDDTLLDTSDCLAPAANLEAARALVGAGLEVPLDVVQRWRSRVDRRLPADRVDEAVCRMLGESRPEVAAAGRRAYFQRGTKLRRQSLRLFPGVRSLLTRLARERDLFLVTWGEPSTQRTKIRLLRLRRWFREVIIVDRRTSSDKTHAIKGLLHRRGLIPGQLLVVGDGWSQEIAAGHRLGTRTCWISGRVPTPSWPPLRPDAVIPDVCGLDRVLPRLDLPTP